MSNRYYMVINYNADEGYSVEFRSTDSPTSDKRKSRTFWYVDEIERFIEMIDRSWTLVFSAYESFYGDPNFTLVYATDTKQMFNETNTDWKKWYDELEQLFNDNGLAHQVRKVADILRYAREFRFTYKDKVAMLLSYFKEMSLFASMFGEVSDFFGGDVNFDGTVIKKEDIPETEINKILADYQTFLLENK